MLKKLLGRVFPKPRLVHVPVDCPPLQHYPGYLPEDGDLLARFADTAAGVFESHYVDGFGVITELACVPFLAANSLNIARLQLPLPDDGFHAEGVEYASLLEAFESRKVKSSFTAVEVGSGWGPWIGLAGVLAKKHGVENLRLIGAEASAERYELMCRHLARNGLVTSEGLVVTTFEGAVWTHDGEVQFPDSDVADMGPAAAAEHSKVDYRGNRVNFRGVPCKRLATLCEGAGEIDFLHIDIQGSECEVIFGDIAWLSCNVRQMMVATHSRVIEGQLMKALGSAGWALRREKPCRFLVDGGAHDAWEGLTQADGSQHWINTMI